MSLSPELYTKLNCPSCGGEITYNESKLQLICSVEGDIYEIKKDIPLMIQKRAVKATGPGRDAIHQMEFDYLEHYKIDAEQFDYFDEQSGATAHSERRLREYIISEIPKETNSILDVGSGSAWLAKQFQSSGVFICSLDATIVNTSKALEKYPSPNHVAVVADAFALPFKKESFDCVVAAEIIEHVSDPSAFVHSLMKVVKPGGMLIISTPYKEVIRYALCIHCNQKTPLNAHLHSFDEHTLRSFFNHESIKHFTWRAFNNKLLLFARSYIVLRYFSFSFWRIIDRLANMIYKKPVNIVITVMKE